MAKLKLPFELEKPSPNEYVTQASQIGYKASPLDTKIEHFEDVIDGQSETREEEIEGFITDKYINTANKTEGSTFSVDINYAGTYAGCHCVKHAVTSGEKYKIYGKGISGYLGLYILTGTGNIVKSVLLASDARTNPVVLEVEEDGYLYVNLVDYDSTTDKVVKIIEGDEARTGIVERLESKLAKSDVFNGLNSTSKSKALSAAQGKVLNEKIAQQKTVIDSFDKVINGEAETQEEEIEGFVTDKYINTYSKEVGSTFTADINYAGTYAGCHCVKHTVTSGEKYKIYGKGTSGALGLYILTGVDNIIKSVQLAYNARTNPVVLNVTENGFLYVNLVDYDSTTDKVTKVLEGDETKVGIVERINRLKEEISEMSGSTSVEYRAVEGGLTNKYYNMVGVSVGSTYNKSTVNMGDYEGTVGYKISVSQGDKYIIKGVGSSAYLGLYVLTNSSNIVKSFLASANTREEPLELTIEEDGYLYVNLNSYNSETDEFTQIVTIVVPSFKDYVDMKIAEVVGGGGSWIGKTVVCFGDSITEGIGGGGYKYTDKLAELSGANIINVGIGGTQFRQRTTPTATPSDGLTGYAGLDIINMVKAACSQDFTITDACATWVRDNESDDNTAITNRLKAINWTNVDAVVFFAGTNDAYNGMMLGTEESTSVAYTLGAIKEIIRLMQTTYPRVSIYWFTPITRWVTNQQGERTDETWSDVRTTTEGKTLVDYVTAITNIVNKNHIPVCDMYWGSGINKINFFTYITGDGTHPNATGYKLIGSKIFSFINANRTF